MTKASGKAALAGLQPKDWFLPAIEAMGSVEHCLDAVLAELRAKSAFVSAVKSSLTSKSNQGQDQLTHLVQRIKLLSQTLEFRVGMLAPDRPQAWFRAPGPTSTGPFAAALLQEPVFVDEDASGIDQLKSELIQAWVSRYIPTFGRLGESPSLWRTLITINTELETLCKLPEPYGDLRLDLLPEGLPSALESRPLRAFLLNVRQEIRSARIRLDECYERLLSASELFWQAQKKSQASRKTRVYGSPTGRFTADRTREEFRERRARVVRSAFLAPADMEALRFMGFDSLPSQTILRQRYLEMAKKLHPDRQGGKEEGFKILTSAYERLLSHTHS